MRIDLAKLQRVEGLTDEDSRVKTLKKTYAAYSVLLSDEAQKIQRGMLQEGQIAADTLDSIGRAQQGR
jgi:GMP synthase PP-ATPase subunit